MPTYQYVCRSCGHSFETVQSMHDAPLTECPRCGGELRKVFAPPAIAFRGSGFYATDHGKKKVKAAADGGPSDTKTGETGSAGDTAKGGEPKKSGGSRDMPSAGTSSKESTSKKDPA